MKGFAPPSRQAAQVPTGPVPITRDMFPPGAAGDFTFEQAARSLSPEYQLREPRKTFRFSVATTF